MPDAGTKAHTTAFTRPPRSAFLRLLANPDSDAELDRLLARYKKPESHARLLRILQDVRFAHQLQNTTARTVSRHKAWFRRADRFRKRIAKLDRDYEALLRDYQKTLYPLLRAGRHLPDGYSRHVAEVFDCMARLVQLIASDPILTIRPTARGHQPEQHKQAAHKALRAIGIITEDADQFLRLIGVKPDLA